MKLKRKPSTDVIIYNREVVNAFRYTYGQQKDGSLLLNDTVRYQYYTASMAGERKNMVWSIPVMTVTGEALGQRAVPVQIYAPKFPKRKGVRSMPGLSGEGPAINCVSHGTVK